MKLLVISYIFYTTNFWFRSLLNYVFLQKFHRVFECMLNSCQDVNISNEVINKSIPESNFVKDWMVVNGTTNINRYNQIGVTLKFNRTEVKENSYIFHVASVKINDTQLPSTTCKYSFKTRCHVNCSNDKIMNKTTPKTFEGNVLSLYEFWFFFALVTFFWASSSIFCTILYPVCLDILGDKPEDFGKQKCWGSVGWGGSSIFFGWLVDLLSINKKEKDYSPIFYSGIIFTICNMAVTTKLEVVETKKLENKWKSVLGLLTKHYVIVFFIWSAINTVFHTIITHFLFWYMEDMVAGNNDPTQRTWIKTLQGLAQGVQCFGGEIPFFFWSGWIINKLGHVKCMALVAGAMALRLFLYTVISNPAWIILIELLNGISYALCFSVKMAFAKIISPPDTINTVIGLLWLFDHLGESMGSLVGGYLFDTYGGVWTFRFFASCSAFICFANILTNFFGITKNLKNPNDKTISTETYAYDNKVTD